MSALEEIAAKLRLETLERLWHRRPAGAFAVAIAGLGALALTTDFGGRPRMTPLGAFLVFSAVVLVWAAWFATTRLPRTKPGHVGFVLSLYAEDDAEDIRLRTDFVSHLRGLLHDVEASHFHLMVVRRSLAYDVDDVDSARRVLARTRAHFMIYGRVRRRLVEGAPFHILTCNGMVRHRPAEETVRSELARDMMSYLPRRVQFAEDRDVFSFEATSEWLEVAARYAIGAAAMISGDAQYAEHQFLAVERRLRTGHRRLPALSTLSGRVAQRLVELYTVWHAHLAVETARVPLGEGVARLEEVARKLLERDANNYGALLSLAMTDFVLRRDLPAAFKKVARCKHGPNANWRYSIAFLYAYKGDLTRARDEYKYAFQSRRIDAELPVHVEEFINAVIAQEPDKVQLHFANALVNEYAKEDVGSAVHHYEQFLATCPQGGFPTERGLAEGALGRLRPQLPDGG